MKPYKNIEYAANRLSGCIVNTIYNDPVYVIGLSDEDDKFSCLRLKDSDVIALMNDELDITPVSLGFVNLRYTVSYLARMPMREDWRQGLRSNNVVNLLGPRFSEIPKKRLYSTIVGSYPKLPSCLRFVAGDGWKMRAFHKHWAVNSAGQLWYKNSVVGKVEGKELVLSDKFSYLSKKLEVDSGA